MSGNNGDPTGSGQSGNGSGTNPNNPPTRPTPPDYVMAEVSLLLSQVTTPETNVTFNAQSRADTSTIKGTINPGQPVLAWTWENAYAREKQQVTSSDVGS